MIEQILSKTVEEMEQEVEPVIQGVVVSAPYELLSERLHTLTTLTTHLTHSYHTLSTHQRHLHTLSRNYIRLLAQIDALRMEQATLLNNTESELVEKQRVHELVSKELEQEERDVGDQLDTERENVESKLATAQQTLINNKDTIKKEAAELAYLQQSSISLPKRKDELEKQVTRLSSEAGEIEKNITSTRLQLQMFQSELRALSQLTQRTKVHENLHNKVNTHERMLSELHEKLLEVQSERERVCSEVLNLIQQQASTAERIQRIFKHAGELEASFPVLQAEVSQHTLAFANLSPLLTAHKHRVVELKAQVATVQSRLDTLNTTVSECNASLQEMSRKKTEISERIHTLRIEYEKWYTRAQQTSGKIDILNERVVRMAQKVEKTTRKEVGQHVQPLPEDAVAKVHVTWNGKTSNGLLSLSVDPVAFLLYIPSLVALHASASSPNPDALSPTPSPSPSPLPPDANIDALLSLDDTEGVNGIMCVGMDGVELVHVHEYEPPITSFASTSSGHPAQSSDKKNNKKKPRDEEEVFDSDDEASTPTTPIHGLHAPVTIITTVSPSSSSNAPVLSPHLAQQPTQPQGILTITLKEHYRQRVLLAMHSDHEGGSPLHHHHRGAALTTPVGSVEARTVVFTGDYSTLLFLSKALQLAMSEYQEDLSHALKRASLSAASGPQHHRVPTPPAHAVERAPTPTTASSLASAALTWVKSRSRSSSVDASPLTTPRGSLKNDAATAAQPPPASTAAAASTAYTSQSEFTSSRDTVTVYLEGTSEILPLATLKRVLSAAPPRYLLQSWRLVYRLTLHGATLKSFYERVRDIPGTILIIRDANEHVFGGFASVAWDNTRRASAENHESGMGVRFYGTGESWVFAVERREESERSHRNLHMKSGSAHGVVSRSSSRHASRHTSRSSSRKNSLSSAVDAPTPTSAAPAAAAKPPLHSDPLVTPKSATGATTPSSCPPRLVDHVITYTWSGDNDYFIWSDEDSLGFGADPQQAFRIDSRLKTGTIGVCKTFRNPPLFSGADREFQIVEVEVWGPIGDADF